jgi:hypothetical protein
MRMMGTWKKNCPLKQRIFLWMCFRGQIQSASQLATRGWPGSVFCACCWVVEDGSYHFQMPCGGFCVVCATGNICQAS